MSIAKSLPTLPAFQLLGQPVEISRVEKELQQLFFEGATEGPDVVGAARASLINLALYNEKQSGLEEDASILAELTSEASCRSLLINADPAADEITAQAWVQVHCQIDRSGRKTVCTEQISFYLTGDSPGMLRNMVFSHLDSDLPLAFWWRGDFSEAFEEGLYSRIDRLMFDSETWDSPRDEFFRLQSAQADQPAPFVMHDLAFTRMNSIRHAIANAFDRPAVNQQLASLGEISMRYASGYRMSAVYLAAWLSVRLGAEIDFSQSKDGQYRFAGTRPDVPANFTVAIEPLIDDRLGTVEVDFQLKGARVEISRCQTRDFIRTLTFLPDCPTTEDWLPAKKLTDVTLVKDVLNRAGRNRTFSLVLPRFQELLML
ncbi:MAG: hypothetical protein CMO47_01965 [Verrucomicrobiales bacterium]|nr:hypothetical protein [Verrucomicrobiales bacterium]|tara:strand:+ start:23178 stop:24296 length:1119 start_codon:yes stop_codon:yes gene_type:complete